MSTRNNTIRTIGTLVVTTLAVIVSTGAAIIPMNTPSAYSQGTPTCKELEEANKNDKFYCREYQGEDGDTRTVVACGEDNGEDFKCNKVIKDGFGENINPATRGECELSSEGEKCKQVE
jgi:hypothetical protein